MVTDPVCKMTIDESKAAGKSEYNGKTYYFCSTHCLNKFKSDPRRHLSAAPAPMPTAPAGAIYTCPMHPEVRQYHPGSCPKCGMVSNVYATQPAHT